MILTLTLKSGVALRNRSTQRSVQLFNFVDSGVADFDSQLISNQFVNRGHAPDEIGLALAWNGVIFARLFPHAACMGEVNITHA